MDSIVLEFAAGAETEGNPAVDAIVQLLKGTPSAAVSTVSANYIVSSNPAFRCAGLALALAQEQPNALSNLAHLWPELRSEPARTYVVRALRDSFRQTTPASVRQLAALIEDPAYTELRSAAITALASIHTKEALPSLAALLRSTDADERIKGIFSLSAFANGCPPQTPNNVVTMKYLEFSNASPYRTDETMSHFAFRHGPAEQERELASFWLEWWTEHEQELTK